MYQVAIPLYGSERASRDMHVQGERDMLKIELEQLQASLRDAQSAYLPVWSHPYYSYARETAEPALKYHREVCSVFSASVSDVL